MWTILVNYSVSHIGFEYLVYFAIRLLKDAIYFCIFVPKLPNGYQNSFCKISQYISKDYLKSVLIISTYTFDPKSEFTL